MNTEAILLRKTACLQYPGQLQKCVKKPLKGKGTVGLSLYFGFCHVRRMLWEGRKRGGNNLLSFDQNKTLF